MEWLRRSLRMRLVVARVYKELRIVSSEGDICYDRRNWARRGRTKNRNEQVSIVLILVGKADSRRFI